MGITLQSFVQNIFQNATVTSSGQSVPFGGYATQQVSLIINVTGPVTGTSPSITFTLREVDPGDGITSIGVSKTGTAITANAGNGNFTVAQASAANLNATITGTVNANIGTSGLLALDTTLIDGSQHTQITDGISDVAVKAASIAAVATDPALVIAVSPNNTVAITAPTLIKGTQGANGLSVQNLKDAGRVIKTYVATATAGGTSEALLTLTKYSDLVSDGTATSFAVTAGKTLRLQSIVLTWRNNTAAAGGVTVRFRTNAAGAAIVSSPVQFTLNATTNLATIGSGTTTSFIFPDGFELSGTMQFALTRVAVTTAAGIDISVIGYEY